MEPSGIWNREARSHMWLLNIWIVADVQIYFKLNNPYVFMSTEVGGD